MIVFIRDIGNWSVPISEVPVTFSEAILTRLRKTFHTFIISESDTGTLFQRLLGLKVDFDRNLDKL